MRLTPSLYVRKLLASIHPPIPPTSPRESRQLLSVLESAFQRQLDETHPSPKALNGSGSTDHSASIPDPAQRIAHSTQSHLDSVLGHPLFKQLPSTHVQTNGLAANAVAIFDDALAWKGLDTDLVQSCALQYLQAVQKKETISHDGRLGPRLAGWFTAMSISERKELLVNGKSIDSLVSVMYADGLEAEVWEWLRLLYERSFDNYVLLSLDKPAPDAKTYFRAEDRLVALMIKETVRRGPLTEAAQQYVKACEYRSNFGKTITSKRHNLAEPLVRSWRQVAGSILLRRKNHYIPAPLFDSILRNSVPIEATPFDSAILQIYHPTSPSAQPLLFDLQNESFLGQFAKWQKKSNKSVRRALLVSILDAAQLSLDQNRAQEAREFLDFAEKTWPDFLPKHSESDTTARLKLARKEIRPIGYTPTPVPV